ncbi:carbohydrate esterase, putative [Phytophthora infestans T30-4]|uniref:Carbohydrate esterase, putative n=1 Tax=Phytophthora infestans (strain T30-4) TaxID=403677 RepID=D0P1J5_PHYIT|nr:carbohydrate esterase, putative [Phytophthora infestans T30-4]EEY54618.1 carbohydrate esterase, putative [Phytophthora infestans T30-4]|eukprot:XP_002895855.1 carbohydrate esterase, putative [Phytophthora infestans T30-4]
MLGKRPFGRPHLVIPYTLNNNDMKFVSPQGFNSGDQFFTYLKDSFDVLLAEGRAGQPKMMSVGLHCRVVGHPGRIAALLRFLDYVRSFDDVWICQREEIARHWYDNFYPGEASPAKL